MLHNLFRLLQRSLGYQVGWFGSLMWAHQSRHCLGIARARSGGKVASIRALHTRGDVVQLVRTLPCHGRGRGFESRRPRHSFQ